jgi:hypothetical protein
MRVREMITDNGSAYPSAVHAIAVVPWAPATCAAAHADAKQKGKAERFLRTLLRGWPTEPIYCSSAEGTAAP